jgi:hypothetical protein
MPSKVKIMVENRADIPLEKHIYKIKVSNSTAGNLENSKIRF